MIKKKGKKYLGLFLFLFGLFCLTGFAYALELNYPSVPGAETPQDFINTAPAEDILPLYVKYFYTLSLTIGAFAACGAIALGAFRYLISTTSPGAMADAKEILFAGVTGLIILLSSYLILDTINPGLTFLQLEKPVIEIPDIEPPPPHEPETKTMVFFQIPAGKTIEKGLLEIENQDMDKLKDDIESLKEKSEQLKEKSEDLKDFLVNCSCGISNCSSQCDPTGCNSICDESEKQRKIREIEQVIEELKQAKQQVTETAAPLLAGFEEIERAAFLMSLLIYDIQDYNNMMVDKHFLESSSSGEEPLVEVKFSPSEEYPEPGFEEWEDIRILFNGRTVNDPATFYFIKEDHEDIIREAANL